jgi:uncharacterized membrane protein YfcA
MGNCYGVGELLYGNDSGEKLMTQSLVLQLVYCGLIGVVVGLMSALLGIGGGVLMVPVLHLLFGKDMQTAVGTSLAAMVLGSVAGAARHAGFQNIDWVMAAALGAGAVVGAYAIGAPLAEALSSEALRRIFGVLMLVFGLRMLGLFEFIATKIVK